jgi:hypothetical protein
MVNGTTFSTIIESARQNKKVIDVYESCVFDGNQCISPDKAVNFRKLTLVQRERTEEDNKRLDQVILSSDEYKKIEEIAILKEKINYLTQKLNNAIDLLPEDTKFDIDVRYFKRHR